jgi:hypothetical protein
MAIVVTIVIVLTLLPPTQHSRISRENALRITEGMTKAEVEDILGPPGDYTTAPTRWSVFSPDFEFSRRTLDPVKARFLGTDFSHPAIWSSDTDHVEVVYCDSAAVIVRYVTCERLPQSILDSLLWRAKRQWRRWFPEQGHAAAEAALGAGGTGRATQDLVLNGRFLARRNV